MRKVTASAMRRLCDICGNLSRPYVQLGGDRVDIRVRRTRKMLFDAYEELLAEKPFEKVSVSEVCARSTVNRATFYRHFADRGEFVAAYLQAVTDRFLARVAADGSDLGLEDYARLMHRELIRFVEGNREVARNTLGRRAKALSAEKPVCEPCPFPPNNEAQ